MILELPILALSGLQTALLAAVMLGICCGVLGSFVVLRRVALVGDALSHAVFPGVVLGLLYGREFGLVQATGLVFGLAAVAGLLGITVVRFIEMRTKLKSDAALGIVLAVFFAVGVAMESVHQLPGVRTFLEGQSAAVALGDLAWMAAITVAVVMAVGLLGRPLQVLSFDQVFGANLGYPVKFLNGIFYVLLAFAVVVAMQAVGVILVSSMLIAPAAAAYLLTDRFWRMMGLSVVFGVAAGVCGTLVSAWQSGLPAGPVIALSGSAVFALSFLFAPHQGLVSKALRRINQRLQIRRENALKEAHKILERRGKRSGGVEMGDLQGALRQGAKEFRDTIKRLVAAGEATLSEGGERLFMTPTGERRAAEIVRNHRLWELYLTDEANYDADHVHEDAEKIEHVLGPGAVRELERQLGFPEVDPHGAPIPQTAEIERTRRAASIEQAGRMGAKGGTK